MLADTYLVITVLSINKEKTAAQILNKGKLLVQWCAGDLQQLKNHNQFRKSVKSVFESYSQKCLLIR